MKSKIKIYLPSKEMKFINLNRIELEDNVRVIDTTIGPQLNKNDAKH